MSRRLLPLLIAFFLLMSQQVAFTHGYAHFKAVQAAPQAANQSVAGTPDPSVVERLCALCISAADLAFAMPGTVHAFDAAAQKLAWIVARLTHPLERSTRVVFLSRAPPQF